MFRLKVYEEPVGPTAWTHDGQPEAALFILELESNDGFKLHEGNRT